MLFSLFYIYPLCFMYCKIYSQFVGINIQSRHPSPFNKGGPGKLIKNEKGVGRHFSFIAGEQRDF